jgi:SulP family sulfate permease
LIPPPARPRLGELLPSALVIAFLAGVASLLSASVADRMIGGKTRPDAEVTVNGAANIGAALFGELPATGAIARTATNVRAGGRTPVAGLLLLTAWNMAEPQHWRRHLAARRSDQVLLVITPVLTVLTDLTLAIGLGGALGLALRLRRRGTPEAQWHEPDR